MSRRVYVYDPISKEMVEKGTVVVERVHDIMPDLPDFVSVIDRSVIHGRRGYREHCRRHGVTNPADFTNHWANFQKKREALFQGRTEDPKRKEAVIRAFNTLQDKRR